MNPWQRTHDELAGAWRSVRYDLGRRAEPGGYGPQPDVTSTGMNTFGVPVAQAGGHDGGYPHRRPRRVAVAGAFSVLAVVGGAGSYFAVVAGVGPLLGAEPAGAEPYPLAVAAPPVEADEAASTARLGQGTVRRPRALTAATAGPVPTTQSTVVVVPVTVAPRVSPSSTPPAPLPSTAPTGPSTPVTPGCDCLTPPVPTPTAPSATPAPSSTPSASPSDSAAPDPSESSASAEPWAGRPDGNRPRYWHWR